MKKLTLILGFILLLSGCSKEEVCYSCDSEIDSWVKSNKVELISMSREELSKFDIPHQQAALRMFSPERKTVDGFAGVGGKHAMATLDVKKHVVAVERLAPQIVLMNVHKSHLIFI